VLQNNKVSNVNRTFGRFWLFIILLQSFATTQAAYCQQTFKVVRNVPYSTAADKTCVGDVFLPLATEKSHPIVIFIHGGGWEGGSTEENEPMAENLADAGFVVFNVNYRLLRNGGEFPGDVNDVKDALAFAASKASQWGGDPKRIGAIGTSAGGHLALMLAYTPLTAISAPHYPNTHARVSAVVSWFGPTDLKDLRGDLIDRYVGNVSDGYRKASPITYANSAVPTLLVHGTADDYVPYTQSKKLLLALRAAGVQSDLHTVVGEGHGFTPGYPAAMAKTISFFKRNLTTD
jgi:acetyl esterase/lipase